MKIGDYKNGTAYIILRRSQFKFEEDFEDICYFLKIPTTVDRIDVPVCEGEYTFR